MGDWCTIESDPGVFTELISKYGVKNVQVQEVWDVDDLSKFKPTYGLIFLFKYTEEKDTRPVLTEGAPGVFFAKQVITNACATQAIISILMNRSELELGPALDNYRGFASALPPDIRGLAIGNSDELRTIHNSFARPEPFSMETRAATSDDDVYHFIAYVPVGGVLYELDGLKEGPISIGTCTEGNWTDVAKPAIRARMERYAQSETGFALMALIENQKNVLEKKLSNIQESKTRINLILSGESASAMDTTAEQNDLASAEPAELQTRLAALESEESNIQTDIKIESQRYAKWEQENMRRRHNYIPFLFNLLTTLSKKDKLDDLITKAKTQEQARRDANKNKAKV